MFMMEKVDIFYSGFIKLAAIKCWCETHGNQALHSPSNRREWSISRQSIMVFSLIRRNVEHIFSVSLCLLLLTTKNAAVSENGKTKPLDCIKSTLTFCRRWYSQLVTFFWKSRRFSRRTKYFKCPIPTECNAPNAFSSFLPISHSHINPHRREINRIGFLFLVAN